MPFWSRHSDGHSLAWLLAILLNCSFAVFWLQTISIDIHITFK